MEKVVTTIERNGMNGEGIAHLNGKVVFVDGGVEGDIAETEITKENKNFCQGKLIKLINKSQFRETPPCPYFGSCGGCDMQHITYQKQLEIKTSNIQGLFNKSNLNFNISPCVQSQNFEYRNKITLYLSKNRKLGFFEKKSNNIIEINSCKLVDNNFNKIIKILNNFFMQNTEFNPFVIKGLAIRNINENYIFNFILIKKISFLKLENYLKLNKIKYSIYYCINTDKKSTIPTYPVFFVGGNQEVFSGEFGIKYPVLPMSFLQVNNQIKHSIYTQILSNISSNDFVLDAYSGAGLLSAIIAKKAKQVFAVEIDPSASKASQDLAKLNKIKNLESICDDVKNAIPVILKNNKIDVVVLDPARKGVEKETLLTIAHHSPKQIIYLSCNPATLARDLKILCNEGYQIDLAQPYDMFPQTANVETLVCLTKTKRSFYGKPTPTNN